MNELDSFIPILGSLFPLMPQLILLQNGKNNILLVSGKIK